MIPIRPRSRGMTCRGAVLEHLTQVVTPPPEPRSTDWGAAQGQLGVVLPPDGCLGADAAAGAGGELPRPGHCPGATRGGHGPRGGSLSGAEALLAHQALNTTRGTVRYTVGWKIGDAEEQVIAQLPEAAWETFLHQDCSIQDGYAVAELTPAEHPGGLAGRHAADRARNAGAFDHMASGLGGRVR